VKNTAISQLGTSGSGNHFVEFGEFVPVASSSHFDKAHLISGTTYLAIVSHSGSRGAGGRVADYYSRLAASIHGDLPESVRKLAWLDLDSSEGQEYWYAMNLMGQYASANHEIIHQNVLRALGARSLVSYENHHNFAWREEHFGRQLIVHRKGATPAGAGEIGYIPGTMVDPGFLVEGLGNAESLRSCSHGAGRAMSRRQAIKSLTYSDLNNLLKERNVTTISCGLDEAPQAYKNINTVMQAQSDLVKILGRFTPKLVKMAPAGEKAED
jgi:tRNA-splicing ligase RtcB